MDRKQGLFCVKISIGNNVPIAVLTGDHFEAKYASVARAAARAESRKSMLQDGSPVYLVADSVVGLAVDARRRALRDGLADCHGGSKGGPCGECAVCQAARDEAFTRIILSAIELPKSDLSKALETSIGDTIGAIKVDAPWNGAMSDDDVAKVFDEMGIVHDKGGEHESY